jgi:hypothetical protein
LKSHDSHISGLLSKVNVLETAAKGNEARTEHAHKYNGERK